MATVDELLVRIDATTESLRRELKTAESAVNRSTKQMESRAAAFDKKLSSIGMGFARSLSGQLAGLGTTVAAAMSVQEVIKAADTFQKLSGRVSVVATSTTSVSGEMAKLGDISKRTGASLESVAETYSRVGVSRNNLGATDEQLQRIVETLSKAGAMTGGGAALEGALQQIAQSFGGTVVQAEEFNSVIDGMPALLEPLAQALNTIKGRTDLTGGSLKALVNDKELSSGEFFQGILMASDAIDASFAKMAPTVERALNNVRTSFIELVGSGDEATGTTKALSDALNQLAQAMSDPAFREGFGEFVVGSIDFVRKAGEVIGILRTIDQAISDFGKAVGGHAIGQGIRDFGAGMNAMLQTSRAQAGDLRGEIESLQDQIRQSDLRLNLSREAGDTAAIEAVTAEVDALRQRALDAQVELNALLQAAGQPIELNITGGAITKPDRPDIVGRDKFADPIIQPSPARDDGKATEHIQRMAKLAQEAGEQAQRAAEQMRSSWNSVAGSLDPAIAAAIRFDEQMAAIRDGAKIGIPTEDIADMVALLEESRTAPIDDYIGNLQQEVELRRLSADEQERMRAIVEAENLARQNGLELTQQQRDAITEAIAQQQQLTAEKERQDEAERKRKKDLDDLNDQAEDALEAQEKVAREYARTIAYGLEDVIMAPIEKGKLGLEELADIAKEVAADLIRLMVRQTVTQPLIGALTGAFVGAAGGGAGAGAAAALPAGVGRAYAMGGVHTSRGTMPLRKYARGGVARTPQLAMFGEGSKPEAYVPLPDGRSIPVTMRGGGGGSAPVPQDVRVNVHNYGDNQVGVERRQGQNGLDIDVIVEKSVNKMAGDGRLNPAMARYGQRPAPMGR